ncbi:hypothetical protein FF38_00541, partial [Lucilia cuprina]
LKHTSNAGGPANGQVRNNSTTSTARNIHLRPQQPLNISTLNASNLQTSTTTTTNVSTLAVNGGPRLSTLLNIASPSTNVCNQQQQQQQQPPQPPSLPLPLPPTGNGNTTTNTTTTTTPVTPIINHLTPNGLNGIGNNLHTYTNQHIALAHAAAVAGTNAGTSNGNLVNSTVLNPNNTTNHTNYTNYTNPVGAIINQSKHGPGPREALTSLGLLCL